MPCGRLHVSGSRSTTVSPRIHRQAYRAHARCRIDISHPEYTSALNAYRTAGKTKRDNLDENEDLLLMKTLRDMNLSKLIAQDVPLFLSLLGDLFPAVVAGASGDAHAEV